MHHPFYPWIGIFFHLIYSYPIYMEHMEQGVSFCLYGPLAQPLKGLSSASPIH